MILNSLYFEDKDCATLLGAVPFEWLIQNRHTSLKNLYTLTGKVSIDVSATGDNNCILRLSSEKLLPEKIRIPERFHAKSTNPSIKRLPNGYFKREGNIKEVVFRLSMDANE